MMIQPIFDLSDNSPARLIEQFKQLLSTGNTGGEIIYISKSLNHLTLKLPLNDNTKNFMGIMFGGAIYAATDPIYLCLLWYRLGDGYLLLDKTSQIEYLRPGLSDLRADFYVDDTEIALIKTTLESKKSLIREYLVELKDENKKLVCKIRKNIYIRKALKNKRNKLKI